MFALSPCYTARLKIKAFMFCGDIVNQSKGMRYIAFKHALEQLETTMKEEGVWPSKTPSEQDLNRAMESTVPFSVDCLTFESWLAFIFIPKLRVLLSLESPLPPMQITPAAEVYLSSAKQRTLNQLQKIDNIANGDIG